MIIADWGEIIVRKRVLFIVLALWMMLTLLSVTAGAADTSGQWGDLEWSYDESSKTLTISGEGAMPGVGVDLPPFYDYKRDIENLVIGSGVTGVSEYAFENYRELVSVTISGNEIKIGAFAFYNCANLETVTFSENTGDIGDEAFHGCANLQTVTFSGNTGDIGDEAFYYCSNLETVTFSGTAGDIGESAFYYCSNLETVTFSGNVGDIGDGAFGECAALRELTFRDTCGNIGSNAFAGCKSLTRVQFPSGVTRIGSGAFSFCENLMAIAFPDTVIEIADPFFVCPMLMDVYFGGDESQWNSCGGDLLFDDDSKVVVHFRKSVLPDIIRVENLEDLQNLQDMFNGGPKDGRADVVLTGNIEYTGTLTIPEKWNVVLDLNGHTLDFDGSVAINMLGNILYVLDSTATDPPDVADDYSAVDYLSGSIKCTGDAIYVQPGRTLILHGGHIEADKSGITIFADRNTEEDFVGGADQREGIDTVAQITGGYVEAAGSAVVVLGKGAEANIRGGVFLSKDAPVISGGEAREEGDTQITIMDAVLIGRSGTPGQLACGVYHPQKGGISISGGAEIYVENGIGVLMRGGGLTVGSKYDRMKIHAGGSGNNGTISGGEALPAGHLIVIDQQGKFYTYDRIYVYLFGDLEENPGAYKPYARLLDGFDLLTPESSASADPGYYRVIPVCTVTFKFLNGKEDKSLTTKGGVVPSWPEDPTWPGYEFRGWSDNVGDLKDSFNQESIFFWDETLYAQWIPEGAHIVHFDSLNKNKATGSDGILTDWPVGSANVFGQPFVGWYTEPEGGVEYSFDHRFTEDCTVYAHYGELVRPHTITFDPNDGSQNLTAVLTDMDGRLTENVWPAAPERDGYCFLGWSLSANYDIMLGKEYASYKYHEFYKDTTLYARWIPDGGYTVTFYPNNGEVSQTRRTDMNGKMVQWPDEPRLNNYTFGGWYRWFDSGYIYASEKFSGNTSLYAYWVKNGGIIEPGKPKMFLITFDANGGVLSPGTGTETVTASDGRLAALPQSPSQEGYTFLGWFTAKDGGTLVTENTIFSESSAIYAHWAEGSAPEQTTYTVTFDSQGGNAVSAQTVANGGKASKPADPTRSGYRFGGWFREAACTTAWNFETDTVTANITLYAKWMVGAPSASTYTITFNANGGSVSPTSAATGTDGKLSALPTPTRDGYIFDGWYTSAGGGQQVTTATVFTEDTTVYAHWTKKEDSGTTYTITFNANGGSVSPTSAATGADGKLSALPTPTRDGYIFDGWYTSASGGQQVTTATVFTADATVYAQWMKKEDPKPIYTITFNANGGSVSPASATTETDGRLASLPTPTRDGYTFIGWYISASGGKQVTTATVFTANTTIYAAWTINTPGAGSYLITVYATPAENGTVTGTGIYDEGASVTVTAIPDSGYRFVFWRENGRRVSFETTYSFTATATRTLTAVFEPTGSGNTGGGSASDNPGSMGNNSAASSSVTISNINAANGTIITNLSNARNGDTVIITPKANSGYISAPPTVKGTSSYDYIVPTTKNADGSYSFTMPEDVVTITGNFVTPGQKFSDVSDDLWYRDSIAYVVENGLMQGSGAGFDPGGTSTRGMVMTILARQSGVDTTSAVYETWYQKGMDWAKQAGVSDGTDPGGSVSREQLVTMLWRFAGERPVTGDLSSYLDAGDIHDWAGTAMIWAVRTGIIEGFDGKLNSQGFASRAELAAILTRFCQNVKK